MAEGVEPSRLVWMVIVAAGAREQMISRAEKRTSVSKGGTNIAERETIECHRNDVMTAWQWRRNKRLLLHFQLIGHASFAGDFSGDADDAFLFARCHDRTLQSDFA